MSIQKTIRSGFSALSPALQQVARYLLDHPNEVLTASMRSIGLRAGSKPATLVRFAQQLGYSGWPELKQALAQDMGLGDGSYGHRAQRLVGSSRNAGLAQDLFSAQQHNLVNTHQKSEALLLKVCALLEQAPQVHAAGFRACHPIAFSFVYVYRLFRSSVHLVDGPGGALEMHQRAFAKGDALVVASFAPYSREAVQVAQAARQAGCRIVALTDSSTSPLSLLADQTLLFSVHSPSFFPSVAAGVALSEALVELLASRAGKAGIARIRAAEAQFFESGAYLKPKTSGRR